MALTHARVSETATSLKGLCDRLKALKTDVDEFLAANSHLSIDWAGTPKPAYINEDVAGNVDGHAFSRAQVANAIGTLAQFKNLMTNAAVSEGDHLGNVNQIAEVDA